MSKVTTKKSTLISLRVPNELLIDLKKIQIFLNNMPISKLIIFATYKDIQRYKEIIKNGNK